MPDLERAGYREPKQDRSARTLNRILEAAERLLDGREFSEVSVHDISAAAGTSVSSFYARFPDKQALLHAVFERFAVEMRERVEAFQAEFKGKEATLEELVGGVIETYMDVWQRKRGLIQTLTTAERGDAVLFERRRALDTEVALRFRDECLRLQPGLAGRGFGRAFEVALPSLAGAIRSAVERPDLFGGRTVHSREELVRELTTIGLRYLDLAPPPTEGPDPG